MRTQKLVQDQNVKQLYQLPSRKKDSIFEKVKLLWTEQVVLFMVIKVEFLREQRLHHCLSYDSRLTQQQMEESWVGERQLEQMM